MGVCVFVSVYVFVCVYVCMCVWCVYECGMWVCMYAYVCECVCVSVTSTNRGKKKHKDRTMFSEYPMLNQGGDYCKILKQFGRAVSRHQGAFTKYVLTPYNIIKNIKQHLNTWRHGDT